MELLLSGYETTGNEPSNVIAHNLHTGTLIRTFRQSTPFPQAACSTKTHLLSFQRRRPQLNVHGFGKENLDQTIILPEVVISSAVSPCDSWLIGGTEKGSLYIWSILSGALIHAFRAHYQPLTHVSFSGDGMLAYTASNDGDINVWLMSSLVDRSNMAGLTGGSTIKPFKSLSGHKRAIVSVINGSGPSISSRLYTASEDSTVRVWDVSTGNLLTTIALNSMPSCMTVDPAERIIYVGNEKGLIWIPLYTNSTSLPENNYSTTKGATLPSSVPSAVGGMGRVVDANESKDAHTVSSSSPITTVALSFDASLIITGDKDGNVLVWDIVSRQVLRRLIQYPSPVTFLKCLIDKINFFTSVQNVFPVLKRMITDDYLYSDVNMMVHDDGVEALMQAPDILCLSSELMTHNTESGWRAKAESTEMELRETRRLFIELRGVHQALWEKYLQK
ncbi:WD repeat protein Crb3 [Schizosaccharomyces cryophilus OY26]|uniref:Pre-rRNA-processing protein IPI3 n=1 Tax=Schizosaccharomyces cryophilus (strain OY26 / ATCC MYA-4695 / CBS 11777 / NBRC 106824 / NRRL Y48691) TaxID=653667 RepID=S9W1G3_SCHCR|nr:WD repeat protein Crb3 [Schizosaccharomyces cryophilus OY26]EPY51825.1 WD repeat protein Crb3 [Schizosaccharomyces cryophilus OY26]